MNINLGCRRFVMYYLILLVAFGTCHVNGRSKRVVNGDPVEIGHIPHQASLQWWNGANWAHMCGGTLIAVNKVLTAAHCVNIIRPSLMRVGLGWVCFSEPSGFEQNFYIHEIFIHSNYSPKIDGFPNDIAVVTLSKNATINKYVNVVQIMPQEYEGSLEEMTCHISGWGQSYQIAHADDILRETNVKKINKTLCSTMYANVKKAQILDSHICVFQNSKSTCNGDSGGPLICNSFLVGVLSWGIKTCNGHFPSVYVLIFNFYNWIWNPHQT